jgi:hypothetical protein
MKNLDYFVKNNPMYKGMTPTQATAYHLYCSGYEPDRYGIEHTFECCLAYMLRDDH